MKIIVLNPPSTGEGYNNRDEMGGMGQKINFGQGFLARLKSHLIHLPVMDLVFIATKLSKNNEVFVIDSQNDDLSEYETLKQIKLFEPEKVFMAVSSSEMLYEKELVLKIKQLFDVKVCGVGEALSYVDIAPFDEHVKEIDTEVIPDWGLFNYKKYKHFPLISKAPVAPVIASRGCPYNCAYCSYTKNQGTKWRPVPLDHLREELIKNRKCGFKGIAFRDPLFSFDRKRTLAICKTLKWLGMEWMCETRPELLDKELLKAMAESGCKGIEMGVESTNPSILKNIGRKPYDLDKVKNIVKCAEGLGIRIVLFFILGLPGETEETLNKTIDFAMEANPSHAEFKVATPYPGTRLYDVAKKNGWIVGDSFGGYKGTMKIDLDPEYLEERSSQAFRKFYFRFGYVWREIKRGNTLKFIRMGLGAAV